MHRTACALAALPLAACIDITGAVGEYGNLRYSLATDYDMGPADLEEASVLTGHWQRLSLALTDQGERGADDIVSVHHTVSPSAGVALVYDRDPEYLQDVAILVEQPGDYTLTTELDGEVFDRMDLRFDAPATLDAATWARAPGAEAFEQVEGDGQRLAEGTQLAFVPIPLDADGYRIVGDFVVEIGADPEGAVVPDYDDVGTYEDGVWGSLSATSVYLIEGGEVTVTVADRPNGVAFAQTFDVQPAF
jgi:hypothetical protein